MKALLLIPLLLLAACQSVSPSPEPARPDPCPKAQSGLRAHSCVAVKATPSRMGALFAWADGTNVWPADEDGMVRLRVRFLDGDNTQITKAWKRFQQIDDIAEGLEVRRAEEGELSDIRVSFGCQGHWSYLGKTASYFPGQTTLNIELAGWATSKEWDRVALHEFMHALGVEHEHQHPNHEVPWNEPAVIDFYGRTQGWSPEQVRFQVLNRGKPRQLRTSGFDDTSLMMYPVPRELTLNGYSVGWNTQLSAGDIALLQDLYPNPS